MSQSHSKRLGKRSSNNGCQGNRKGAAIDKRTRWPGTICGWGGGRKHLSGYKHLEQSMASTTASKRVAITVSCGSESYKLILH